MKSNFLSDTPQKKRELKRPALPIIIQKNGTSEVSYLNIRKTLLRLEGERSKASSIYHVVHIADVLNRKNIRRAYIEMDVIPDRNYDLVLRMGSLWWDLMDNIPDYSDGKDYGDLGNALTFGRFLSCSLHIHLHKLYDNARHKTSKQGPQNLAGQMVRFESMYDDWLYASRNAARNDDHLALLDIYEDIQFTGFGEFAGLVSTVGSMDWEQRGYKSIGLRACQLSRKMAFLLASTIYLRARMVRSSSRSGLRKVSTSRKKLRRRTPNVQLSLKGLKGLEKYTRLPIAAYVNDITWLNRGNKPYSFATEVNGNFDIRLYYKNMLRSGMSADTWIWVKGKKEGSNASPRVVAEFEGVGQHQGTYWEDYLVTELRDAYNLYPGSLHMEWEFPVLGKRGALNDIVSRINK